MRKPGRGWSCNKWESDMCQDENTSHPLPNCYDTMLCHPSGCTRCQLCPVVWVEGTGSPSSHQPSLLKTGEPTARTTPISIRETQRRWWLHPGVGGKAWEWRFELGMDRIFNTGRKWHFRPRRLQMQRRENRHVRRRACGEESRLGPEGKSNAENQIWKPLSALEEGNSLNRILSGDERGWKETIWYD